ncbi:MAG: WcaI family glycosyltransferase [Pseudomonadota bacterium]|nr:WcaI family glycosyltransferase [Pseudomonadota bacterium]
MANIRDGNDRQWHDGTRVPVWRCPLWVPTKPNGAKRLLHLASFAASSTPVALAQARWRPNLVFTVEPTLFSAPVALLTAKLSGAKSWLHIQDLEVDAAFDMGLLPKGYLKHVALWLEHALLSRFDRITTISERMLARVEEKNYPPEKLSLFPNWADINTIHPLPDKASPFRLELDIKEDQTVALYAGNLGEKQGLELLADAARMLKDRRDIVFVIAGAGSARERLKDQTSDLPNVRWLPLQPLERLNDLLSLADIHLLPQRADAADLVMPSKLTGMLASGRPVVATVTPETQVGRIVETCGILAAPGDTTALTEAIAALAADTVKRRRLGNAARAYAERNLDRDAIMNRFSETAMTLCHLPAEKETA